MPVVSPDGLWSDVRTGGHGNAAPALFLDRDGTLIELVAYLANPDDVRLIDEAVEAVRKANSAGVAVVIVTNQSGIGRGYYDWAAFEAVQERLYALLADADAFVDAAYACPHAPANAGGPAHSAYRKPAPGMLLRAKIDLSLDLTRSQIVGDSASDLAAGRSAGLSRGVLVGTGYGERDRLAAEKLEEEDFTVAFGLHSSANHSP